MTINISNQPDGAKRPFVLPASIRVPVTVAIFLAGVAVAFTTALQPTDGPDMVADIALTTANVIKGLLLGLPFSLTAIFFFTFFGPSDGTAEGGLPAGDVAQTPPEHPSN